MTFTWFDLLLIYFGIGFVPMFGAVLFTDARLPLWAKLLTPILAGFLWPLNMLETAKATCHEVEERVR